MIEVLKSFDGMVLLGVALLLLALVTSLAKCVGLRIRKR